MSFHAGQTFTFGETPSATKWNYLWENDYALQDWTAFTNDTFPIALIQDGDITAAKLDADAIGHGFVEIGRATLGSAGDTITINPLTVKKYLRIIVNLLATGGTVDSRMRFNNDSGTNYAYNSFYNNSGTPDDDIAVSQQGLNLEAFSLVTGGAMQCVLDITNLSTHAKSAVGISRSDTTLAATTAPVPYFIAGKWVSNNQISRVDIVNGGTGDFAIGSEVIVFGKD